MFTRPEIRVVFDTALFVSRHSVTLHNPFDGALSIDYVFIGGLRDTFDGDTGIVDDRATYALAETNASFLPHSRYGRS